MTSQKFRAKLLWQMYVSDLLDKLNIFKSIRRFFDKVWKGCLWFKHSWGVYWFDYSYIEITLAWMLEYMGNRFIRDGITESAKQHGQEMIFVSQRLRDLSDGKIEDAMYREHETLFPNKPKISFDEKLVKVNGMDYYEWVESGAEKEYAKTPEGKKEREAFKTLHKRIENKVQKERSELYNYIASNIINWWD